MHARGFSDAGVWFDRPTDGVWHPNVRLAGVCTHYYPRRKLLSILRIEQVMQFLDEPFPATVRLDGSLWLLRRNPGLVNSFEDERGVINCPVHDVALCHIGFVGLHF
jgi:hypothetical protein